MLRAGKKNVRKDGGSGYRIEGEGGRERRGQGPGKGRWQGGGAVQHWVLHLQCKATARGVGHYLLCTTQHLGW